MSVWPKTLPVTPSLSTAEGALVSVSIHAEPHCLESLLEALAQVSFPINPQIYHDAALVYRFADGREQTVPITLVEFPAYENRLDEVRRAVVGLRLPARLHTHRRHAGRHPVGPAKGTRSRRRAICLALSREASCRCRLAAREILAYTTPSRCLPNLQFETAIAADRSGPGHSHRPVRWDRLAESAPVYVFSIVRIRLFTFEVVLFTIQWCFRCNSPNNFAA